MNNTTTHVGRRTLSGLTALGTNQATAFPLLNLANHEFTTVGSSTGAVLPTARLADSVTVWNGGSNTLSVYPPSGGTVSGGSVNVAYSLAADTGITFFATDLLTWYPDSAAQAASGTGTVTTVSVVSAHGFAGTVANPTTTPAITLSTTATGILTGNGTSIAAAADVGIGANNQLALTEIATPATQVSGDIWTDSTQHSHAVFNGSATSADCLTGYLPRLIYAQPANITVSASGTATTLLSGTGAVGTVSLPAGFLSVKGRVLRVRWGGYITTAASAQGNVYWLLKAGSTLIATSISGGLTANVTSPSPIAGEVNIAVKTAGSSGKLDATGNMSGYTGGQNTTGEFSNGTAGVFAPATQTSIDLTAALTLDFQIFFSATGNSFTLNYFTVEVIG